jgi:hypothetical protein
VIRDDFFGNGVVNKHFASFEKDGVNYAVYEHGGYVSAYMATILHPKVADWKREEQSILFYQEYDAKDKPTGRFHIVAYIPALDKATRKQMFETLSLLIGDSIDVITENTSISYEGIQYLQNLTKKHGYEATGDIKEARLSIASSFPDVHFLNEANQYEYAAAQVSEADYPAVKAALEKIGVQSRYDATKQEVYVEVDEIRNPAGQRNNRWHDTDIAPEPISRAAFDRLTDKLGISDRVVLDRGEMERLYNENKGQAMATPDGDIYGFVAPDGTIYIDPDLLNANTPIHEAGHLIWHALPKALRDKITTGNTTGRVAAQAKRIGDGRTLAAKKFATPPTRRCT